MLSLAVLGTSGTLVTFFPWTSNGTSSIPYHRGGLSRVCALEIRSLCFLAEKSPVLSLHPPPLQDTC